MWRHGIDEAIPHVQVARARVEPPKQLAASVVTPKGRVALEFCQDRVPGTVGTGDAISGTRPSRRDRQPVRAVPTRARRHRGVASLQPGTDVARGARRDARLPGDLAKGGTRVARDVTAGALTPNGALHRAKPPVAAQPSLHLGDIRARPAPDSTHSLG